MFIVSFGTPLRWDLRNSAVQARNNRLALARVRSLALRVMRRWARRLQMQPRALNRGVLASRTPLSETEPDFLRAVYDCDGLASGRR
jgi:hypothetical protein